MKSKLNAKWTCISKKKRRRTQQPLSNVLARPALHCQPDNRPNSVVVGGSPRPLWDVDEPFVSRMTGLRPCGKEQHAPAPPATAFVSAIADRRAACRGLLAPASLSRLSARASLLGLFTILNCGYALANDQVDNKQEVHKIKRINKLIVSKTEQEAETMVKPVYGMETAVIPKKYIEQHDVDSNATTILNSVPGVNATSMNPIGTRTHISVRGFSQTQIGYTFDNIPIGDLFYGGLGGGDINYGDLSTVVPVTLGQTSGIKVSYGPPQPYINSFGAIGGNVNYLPKLPGAEGGTAYFSYGSFNTRGYGLSYDTGRTGLGNLYMRFSSRQTGNYLQDTPSRIYSYYAAYNFPTISPESRWSLIFLLNKTAGYVPARMPENILNQFGKYYQWQRNFTWATSKSESITAILQNKTLLSERSFLDTKAFYTYIHNDRTEYVNPQNPLSNIYYSQVETLLPVETVCQYSGNDYAGNTSPECQDQTINGDNFHSYDVGINTLGLSSRYRFFSRYINLDVGGLAFAAIMSHSQDYVYGSLPIPTIAGYNDLWDEHAYRIYGKGFVQLGLKPMKDLIITPGFKLESVTSHINDVPGYYYDVGASSGRTYLRVSPYVGFQYKPFTHYSFYATDAIGFKYPNISAFYSADSNATPTTPSSIITIKPERVDTYQIGASYKSNRLNLNITLYDAFFNNTFSSYVNPDTGITYEYNVGKSQYKGINFAANYNINKFINIFGSYSLQNAVYTNSVTSAYGFATHPGEVRPNTPTYLASIGANLKYNSTALDVSDSLVGSQFIENYNGGPSTDTLPAYNTLNVILSHRFNINSAGAYVKAVTLSLSADNIANSQAYVLAKLWPYLTGDGEYIQAQPLMPRAFFGTLKFQF